MKKLLIFTILCFSRYIGFSQAYIPMPVDSAIWRYRYYNIDYETQVMDCILYVNGTDTVAPAALGGRTYHKIFSRSYIYTVPDDSIPPIVPVIANSPDTYYGAMRDSGQQVFLLTISGEIMMFDFTATVGDSIPAYSGKDKVVAIDSVLLGSVYHRRFLTTDSTYYVIEGVGSNRGLIPDINDGSGVVQFFCFTDTPIVYSPDSGIACTYVYPVWYGLEIIPVTAEKPEVNLSPVPTYDILHITTSVSSRVQVVIYNSIGQVIWRGDMLQELDIEVGSWAKGVYYMQCISSGSAITVKKFLVM